MSDKINSYCAICGAVMAYSDNICTGCGQFVSQKITNDTRIGFSDKIHDPAFIRYTKNTNRWPAVFATILAVMAIAGFYIYGESSRDMDNPQALYIGLGIAGMFLLIALFQILGRKRSRTWDGCVIDKTIKSKARRERYDHDGARVRHYTEYTVIIRADNGRMYNISAEDDDTIYNYYYIGDRVRHHAKLNSYEKYDKSKDNIIFCSACATLCDMNDDICSRCKCPLLK